MEHDPQHVADIIERELAIHRAEISRLSAENAELRGQRITTRCPSCGGQHLFVGTGGHLTCSWLKCKEPSVADAIESLKSRLKLAEDLAEAVEKFAEQKPLTVTAFMGKALQAFRASQKGGE